MRLASVTVAALLLADACAAPVATPTPSPSSAVAGSPSATAPITTPSPTPTLSPSPGPTQTASANPTNTATQPPTLAPASPPTGWTELSDFAGTTPGTRMTGVAYGNGVYIAVGAIKRSGNEKAVTWISVNGVRWIERGQANFPDSFEAVAFNGTDFYAFGSAPTTVWTTPDGNHWDKVDLPISTGEIDAGSDAFSNGSVTDATSAGSQVYAAGDSTVSGGDIICDCVSAWRSTDGIDWTHSTVFHDDSFQTFAVLPDMALVVGHGSYIGQSLHTSTDFVEWVKPDVAMAEGSGYLDAAASDDRIVAVGYWGDEYDIPISLVWDGHIWSGTSFDEHSGAPAEQVTWAGGRFVAVGTGAGVIVSWWSADGSSWTRGPDVGPALTLDLGELGGDDPFNHRTIGAGDPGVVLAQTGDDGLHVWFAPVGVFGP